MTDILDVIKTKKNLTDFAKIREYEKFHSPLIN